MKFRYIIAILFILFGPAANYAQDAIVSEFLQQYSQGRMAEVRTALPDLLVEYPTDAGVKLLLAVVLEDADKALEIYKEIIAKSPESPWADDAYWRLVQYYGVKGDIDKAEFELANFRKRYPTSEFLLTATDVVRTCRSFTNSIEKKLKAVEKKSAEAEKAGQKPEGSNQKKENSAGDSKQSGSYGLQVGVFGTLEKAEIEKERFMANRLRTTIEEKLVEGKKMFAVVIGNYSSMDAAEAAKQIIQQQCNCNPVIYQK